jgi:hypothetical protein
MAMANHDTRQAQPIRASDSKARERALAGGLAGGGEWRLEFAGVVHNGRDQRPTA